MKKSRQHLLTDARGDIPAVDHTIALHSNRLTDMESGKSREVIQFHYTTWPDFGIPSSPVAFLQFLKEVRDSGTLDRDVGPFKDSFMIS